MSELLGAGIQTYQFPTGKFLSFFYFQHSTHCIRLIGTKKDFSQENIICLVEKDTDHWMFYRRQGITLTTHLLSPFTYLPFPKKKLSKSKFRQFCQVL